MSSILETVQKKRFLPTKPFKDDLPVSQSKSKDTNIIGLRRRISSFSVRIQPLSAASAAWAIRKSQSMPSFGEFSHYGSPLKRWWDWSWSWILSRKPSFANDLEFNEEETPMLGFQSRGTLRHVFYKLRSEIRKLVRSDSLPTSTNQRFRYDSFSYAQNFDDGKKTAL